MSAPPTYPDVFSAPYIFNTAQIVSPGPHNVTTTDLAELSQKGPVLINFFFGSQQCSSVLSDLMRTGFENKSLTILQYTPIPPQAVSQIVEGIDSQLKKAGAPITYPAAFISCSEADPAISAWINNFEMSPGQSAFHVLLSKNKVIYAGEPGFECDRYIAFAVASHEDPSFNPSTFTIFPSITDPKFAFQGLTKDHLVRGELISLPEQKCYMIEFSARFCQPCLSLLPHIVSMSKKYNKVPIFQVFEEEETEAAFAAVDKTLKSIETAKNVEITHTVVVPPLELIEPWKEEFGINAIPFCVMVDEGKAIYAGHPAEPKVKEIMNNLHMKYGGEDVSFKSNDPDFSIPIDEQTVIRGEAVDPTTLSGISVISFTAEWCGPCSVIQPTLNKYAEKYTNIKFVQIYKDSPEKAKAKVDSIEKQHNYRHEHITIIHAPQEYVEPWYDALEINGIPFVAVFNDGKLVFRGYPAEPSFVSTLEKLNKQE